MKTRIPKHYLEMIETDNYSMIADQLYLLPFVRRYAVFLGLDGDEITLQFVHEVQHAEGTPLRAIEPMELSPRRRRRSFLQRNRRRLIAVGALIGTSGLLFYLAHERGVRPPLEAAIPAAISSNAPTPVLASSPIPERADAAPSGTPSAGDAQSLPAQSDQR